MPEWRIGGRSLERPAVMGVVNVTPDSFSDGGLVMTPAQVIARGLEMEREGASILDLGGESTRPGATAVPLDLELERVVPAVAALSASVSIPISIDTMKAEVARRAIEAGASIVNDVSGLTHDPAMLGVIVDSGASVVVMHMQGRPGTMQDEPRYEDVVGEVYDFLAQQVDRLVAAGLDRASIAIDPGIGFGKTLEHNLLLLQNLRQFASLGNAVLVGTSRKRMLGAITGRDVHGRTTASAVSALAAVVGGADVVRVHDVGPTVDALKVWAAQVGLADEPA